MRFFRGIWRFIRGRRGRIALVWLAFGGIALLALGYVGADYWGKWRVRQYLENVEARGEPVTLEAYFDRGIPEEDNVLRHPAMVEELKEGNLERLSYRSFTFPRAPHPPARNPHSPKGKGPLTPGIVRIPPESSPELAEVTPVKDWFYPRLGIPEKAVALKLLDDLKADLERADNVAEALARPALEWPPELRGPDGITGCVHAAFTLRSIAQFHLDTAVLYLAAEKPDRAEAQLIRSLGIADLLTTQMASAAAVVLAHNVRSHILAVAQEGAMRDAWTEAHLDRLVPLMRFKRNPRKLLREVIETELVFGRELLRESLRRGWERDEVDPFADWEWNIETIEERFGSLWPWLRPAGLEMSETVDHLKELRSIGKAPERDERGIVQIAKDFESRFEQRGKLSFLSIAAKSLTDGSAIAVLAETGLALERYKIREGGYPASLEKLVPDGLDAVPEDPWTGEPLRYERLSNGGPRLWSVGPNEVDDGGMPHRDWMQGDHVWITRPIPGFTEADYER